MDRRRDTNNTESGPERGRSSSWMNTQDRLVITGPAVETFPEWTNPLQGRNGAYFRN